MTVNIVTYPMLKYLVEEIKEMNTGVQLGNAKVPFLLCADDIAVRSETE